MKRKLTAIGYTLFFALTVLASPVFLDWYMVDVLGRENSFENIPPGVSLLYLLLFIGQALIAIYLWAMVFNTNEK